MRIITAILKVREHRKSEKFAEVEFLVDSGAVYSLVPGMLTDKFDISWMFNCQLQQQDKTLDITV
jgi:uncharacterized glyoxalase superfamily protein PhnB